MAKINVSHPYFPRDMPLPHYKPNENSMVEILALFFGVVAVALGLTWIYTGRIKFGFGDRLKMCWFMSCTLIHSILEGYFSINHKTFPGEQTYLAQMWKEYSKADSRYVGQDAFTVCMETITGFIDGPLSLLAFYAFVNHLPYRFVVQLILSLCQLYGDVLYFMTEIKEGFIHGEMYHPLHFWFYFFFLNAIWIVVPLMLIYQSWTHLTAAQAARDEQTAAPGEDKKRK